MICNLISKNITLCYSLYYLLFLANVCCKYPPKGFFFPSLPCILPPHLLFCVPTSPLPVSQQYSVYPIIWAAGRGHADIVHLLLQNGAKVNCSDKVGQQDLSRFQSVLCALSVSKCKVFHVIS